MSQDQPPRMIDPLHPVNVALAMFVNAIGIALILATYILGHNLLGLNLLEALVVWFFAQCFILAVIIF